MTVTLRKVIYLHAALSKHDGERSSMVSWGSFLTSEMASVETKPFVPARDFEQSEQFYQHLGFELSWSDGSRTHFRHGNSSFLLQKLHDKERADNVVIHLLVVDVEAWWQHVQAQDLKSKYEINVDPPKDRPWGIREFVIVDPSGVLWRIGQSMG
ncbi:VOC family protein [Bradyrhizobium sp. AZCC 1693]|uniref:VOC family protein n=1 Tax=Bradyrhizobium sp. AZCC 1693 TaxID=3117029 RepID=UPI002FF26990